MNAINHLIDMLQGDDNVARAIVSFPERPMYFIQVQLAAVNAAGVRMLSLFASVEHGGQVVENVVQCHPNATTHCGYALSRFFLEEKFRTSLIDPVLRKLDEQNDELMRIDQENQVVLRALQQQDPRWSVG